MMTVPVIAAPAQRLRMVLANQPCKLLIQQKRVGLFLDLAVNDVTVLAGALCRHAVPVLRDTYHAFAGDLMFLDTRGADDPQYTELGSRWLLLYIEPGQIVQ